MQDTTPKEHQADDYILRVTAADGMIRAFLADTRKTVYTSSELHHTSAVVSAALGRLLTAGAMMGLMLKNDGDLLTLKIRGTGPVGGLLVTADRNGRVKGYPQNPAADVPNKPNGKLDVSGVIGAGTLTVIKDMGLSEPYNGTIELKSGEIAEDITYYFVQSEQTPSAVSLGVLVDGDYTIRQAGGFIIQLMPGASEEVLNYLENKLNGLDSLTNLYEQGHTPESLAGLLFAEIGYEELERTPVCFHCDCSLERAKRVLISMGHDELTRLRQEDHSAELHCQFCNREYHFDEPELDDLIAQAAKHQKK